jgi:hypothetical protein
VDVQPLDLEILDLQASDHRPADRQPAHRQRTDGTGADGQRADGQCPGRGRADPGRRQLRRDRLGPATPWCREDTKRTWSSGHDSASFLHGQVLTQSAAIVAQADDNGRPLPWPRRRLRGAGWSSAG